MVVVLGGRIDSFELLCLLGQDSWFGEQGDLVGDLEIGEEAWCPGREAFQLSLV